MQTRAYLACVHYYASRVNSIPAQDAAKQHDRWWGEKCIVFYSFECVDAQTEPMQESRSRQQLRWLPLRFPKAGA